MGGIRAWVSAGPPKIRGLLCFDCFLLPRTHSPYPARAPGGRRPDESETEDGPPPASRLAPRSSPTPTPPWPCTPGSGTVALRFGGASHTPTGWSLIPRVPLGKQEAVSRHPGQDSRPGLVLPHVSDRWLGLFRVRTTPGSRGRGVCHWEEREDASRAQKGARSGLHAMLCSSGGNASVGTFIISALFCGYIVL